MGTIRTRRSRRRPGAAAAMPARGKPGNLGRARLLRTIRHQARLPAVAVAASSLVFMGASAAHSGQRAPRPSSLAGASSAAWTRLPLAPIAPRSEYAGVWTGKQLIVWGGYSNSTQYQDGAAYDPATRTWTKIAPSPLAAREFPVSVWTGKEMLVFGGVSNSGAYSDGAAYDPTARTWRKLAPIPTSLGGNLTGSGSYAVWTGKVMLTWGFFGDSGGTHGGGSLAAATYNPATNSWTKGTAAPAQAPLFGDAFWTGKEMIVWGSSPVTGSSAGHLEGFSYQPATGKWAKLPASPLGRGGRDSMLAVWTGSRLVVGGGATTSLQKDAAAYDPVTGTWTRLPDAPVGFEGNWIAPDIWTGASVITMEDGVKGGRPLSLDLATGHWSLGPKAPVPGRQEAHEVWTGSQVLVWGGGISSGIHCCEAVKQGDSYTP